MAIKIFFITISTLILLISQSPQAAPEATKLKDRIIKDCGPLKNFHKLIGNWIFTSEFISETGETVSSSYGESRFEKAFSGRGIRYTEWHHAKRQPSEVYSESTLFVSECETGKVLGSSNNTIENRKFWDGELTENGYTFIQTGDLFIKRDGDNEVRFIQVGQKQYIKELAHCLNGECKITFRMTFNKE